MTSDDVETSYITFANIYIKKIQQALLIQLLVIQ